MSAAEDEAWLALARALADTHAGLRPPEGRLVAETRRALAATYLLLNEAPMAIVDDFADVEPEYLDYCGLEWSFGIMRGDLAWQGVLVGRDDAIRAVGGQLRALDTALHSLVGHGARPSDPNGAWAVENLPAFVVPRRRARRESQSAAGLSFTRNALVYHRVLPASLEDCRLRFQWLDLHHEASVESWNRPLGAAMFRPFRLKTEPVGEDGGFIVVANDPVPHADVIDRQLKASSSDRCLALVWPEVSLPPEVQRHVIRSLKEISADLDQPAFETDLLVLGSWHEPATKGHVNRSRIVDALGEEVATHAKVMPYRSKREPPGASGDQPLRKEAIVRGEELTIVVTQDQLIAVVICRDLCDRLSRAPFCGLDVDLVLVPSLGNETTLEGHLSRAEGLHILFGTQTFVAQHPKRASQVPTGGYGWVVRPADRPTKSDSVVLQTEPYAPYQQLPPQTSAPIAGEIQ